MKYTKIIGLVIAISLIASCNSKKSEEENEAYQVPPEIEQVPFGTKPGLRAPEIELPDVEGNTRKLSELHGKVVLVDFWAAWCNPCRMENPHLVKVYDQYSDKEFTVGNGFEIVSVSLDRNEEAWREAIEKDKLDWPYQLGDMKGARTEAALDYGVQMIPSNFLLDKNGVILDMNLRGDALNQKLESLLDD